MFSLPSSSLLKVPCDDCDDDDDDDHDDSDVTTLGQTVIQNNLIE